MKLVVAVLLMFSATLKAQECSGDQVISSLLCSSAQLPDIRLYISEYQTCDSGKITELSRSLMGMTVFNEDIHTIDAENIVIKYSEKRTLIDPAIRSDYLSFLLPEFVTMMDGEKLIEMTITDILVPDYEGSQSTHFKASYKMNLQEAELFCFVYR